MKERLFGTRLLTEEPQVSRTLVHHDGMHVEDDFTPAVFRSTRQHRLNFDRIQESAKISEGDDAASVSFEREEKLYARVRAMLREQLVSLGFSRDETQKAPSPPKRKPQVSLSYDDDDDEEEFIDTAKRIRLDLAKGDAMQEKVLFTSRRVNIRQDSLGYIQRNFTRLSLGEDFPFGKRSKAIPQAPEDYVPRATPREAPAATQVARPPSLSSRFVSASETPVEEDSGEISPHITLQSREISSFEVPPLLRKRLGLT